MSLKLKKVLRVVSKVVLILVGICIFLYFGFVTFVSITFKPHDVRLTNVTDTSFTVSWITNYPMKGIVYYKDSDSFLPGPLSWIGSGKAYDDRDVAAAQEKCVEEYNKEHGVSEDFVVNTSDYDCVDVEVNEYDGYYTHHVTLKNLDSNKMYYFRIGDGYFSWKRDINASATFYTLEDTEVNAPTPIYGKIVNESGEYIDDSVVYIKFTNEYIGKESMYYSSVTNENGGWYLDGNNIRTIEGEAMLVENAQDMITVYAQYQNYTLSDEHKWVYGNTNIGYPDIVVSDEWEKDLSQKEKGTELVYRSYAGTLDDYVYNYNTYIAKDKDNDGKKDYVTKASEIKYDNARELATAIVAASNHESVEKVEEAKVTETKVANAQTLINNAKKVEEAKAAEKAQAQKQRAEDAAAAEANQNDCTYSKRSDPKVCSVTELFANKDIFGAGYTQNELLRRVDDAGEEGIKYNNQTIKTNLQLITALGYCGSAMACASNYNLLESEKGYAIKTDQLICEDDDNPTNCLFKKNGDRVQNVVDINYNPETKAVTFETGVIDKVDDVDNEDNGAQQNAFIFTRSGTDKDFALSLGTAGASASIHSLLSKSSIESINKACKDKTSCTVCLGIGDSTKGCDKVISTSEIDVNAWTSNILKNIESGVDYNEDYLSDTQKFLDFCKSSMDAKISKAFPDGSYVNGDLEIKVSTINGGLKIIDPYSKLEGNNKVQINAYIEGLLGLHADEKNNVSYSDLKAAIEKYNTLRTNISNLSTKITEVKNTEEQKVDVIEYTYANGYGGIVNITTRDNGELDLNAVGAIPEIELDDTTKTKLGLNSTTVSYSELVKVIDEYNKKIEKEKEQESKNTNNTDINVIEYTYRAINGSYTVEVQTLDDGTLKITKTGNLSESTNMVKVDENITSLLKEVGLEDKIDDNGYVTIYDLETAIGKHNKKIEEGSMLLKDSDSDVLSQMSTLLRSILTNPLLSTVAYAAGSTTTKDTTGEGYIFYLPEYGIYDMEVAGLTETERIEGGNDNLQIFYIEMNGKDGLQLPADPDNPQVGEDFVLQSEALEIKYKEVAEPNPLSIKKGINIISFDYIPVLNTDNSSKASALLEWFAKKNVDVNHISYFEGGRWKGIGYVDGETVGNDFTIIPGKGYLLYSEEEKTVNIPGYDITQSIPVPLYSGWNLIGVHGYTKAYTAQSLLESINSIEGLTADNISWWPTSEGKYEGLQITDGQVYGLDFAISKLNGYFVRISKFEPKDKTCGSIIWHPSGKLNGKCGNSKTVN